MPRKYLIVLFFLAFVGARHAVPLQGLAFADSYTQDGKPCPPECVSDSMEIVTWYPSPYNEYEELRLYPKRSANESQCNSFEQLGLMYYNQDEYTLKIYRQDPATFSYGWEKIVLGEGLWKLSGNDIENSNSGNVTVKGNLQDGSTVIYNSSTKKIPEETLPFKKGDLIAPGDRPLISAGANYTTGYFSIQELGISGLSASNVKQGVKFGPGKSITGTATFTAPSFTLSGTNPTCPSGYKATQRSWNSRACTISLNRCPMYYSYRMCYSGGGTSVEPPTATCGPWRGNCYKYYNSCQSCMITDSCTANTWSQVTCVPQ